MAVLEIENARSRISGLPPEIFRLLRYELSYREADPGIRQFMQADGSIRRSNWDGYRRLMTVKGVFPSGLVPRAIRLLRKWGVSLQIRDQRIRPEPELPLWVFPEGFELRDYQSSACLDALKIGRGVIDSPPRSGKTVMMAELIRDVSAPTVITSPTAPIAKQTFERLVGFFADNPWAGGGNRASDFYLLTGGPPKTRQEKIAAKKAIVFVATAATAANMSEAWWAKIRCLIVDERHHQAAKTYRKINDLAINAYWRWGFTGTDYRSKQGEHVALEACLGRSVARFSIGEMIDRGVLSRGEVEFIPIDRAHCRGIARSKFQTAYKRGVSECEYRNAQIVAEAQRQIEDGRRVLVLVQRLSHGRDLEDRISGSRFVSGEDGVEVREAVAALDSGELRCVIGSPVVGEGLDCPAADCLIYAKGFKARVTHTQDVFRVLTAAPGKPAARIIDFADRHNKTLLEHSIERLKNYQAMGLPCSLRA